jgi:ubiquinone/menaquinone biosynthesis C-methylase UbiE
LIYLNFEDDQSEVEIAYALIKSAWNKGYATELAKAMVEWGFKHIAVNKLVAVAKEKNLRSRHVLEKAQLNCIGLCIYNKFEVVKYEIYKPASTYDPYCIENIPLFEALYGENLISLGGTPAIKNMLTGLDLELNGLKALDLGFGLGGVAYYLARTYQMQITGIEIYPWMVKHASDNTPAELTHLLEFDTYNADNKIVCENDSFDLIYSKGVLNHVRDKSDLFLQVNALLKDDGLFAITDWIYPYLKSDSTLVYETQETYEKVLTDSGFTNITFRNDSETFLGYTYSFLKNLMDKRNYIEETFNKELFATILKQHQDLAEDIKNKRKIAVRIVARK